MMSAQARLELSGASGDLTNFNNVGGASRGGNGAAAPGVGSMVGYGSGPTLDRAGSIHSGGESSRGYAGGMAGHVSAHNGSYPEGELSALTKVLSLEELSTGSKRWPKQSELESALLFASSSEWHGPAGRPPGLYVREEQKKMMTQLRASKEGARSRSTKLMEAVVKLDKYVESLNIKKRSRPDATSAGEQHKERQLANTRGAEKDKERPTSSAPLGKGMSPSGGPHGSSSSGSAGDGNGAGNMKTKSGVPNKRVRTAFAEGRGAQEGGSRPGLPAHQKSRGPGDRSSPRPVSSLPSLSGEIPSRPNVTQSGASDGADVKKMKGKRSRPKVEQSAGANGTAEGGSEGTRENKWVHSAQRLSTDGRARSENHTLRPAGPVHGVTSMHKAEAGGVGKLGQSSSVRSSFRGDPDGAGGRGDAQGERAGNGDKEKERTSPKDGPTRSFRDANPLPSPGMIVKGKATRGPRSSAAGPNSQASLGRAASFVAESRDRPSGLKKNVGGQPASSSEKKRKVSSRSPSPKPHWVGQRPQKMSRVARAAPLTPPVLARDDGEGGDNVSSGMGAVARDGERVRPSSVVPGGIVPVGQRRNVSSSSGGGIGRSRSMNDRGPFPSVPGSDGEESTGGADDGRERGRDKGREREKDRSGDKDGREKEKDRGRKGGPDWEDKDKSVGPLGVRLGQIPSGKRSGTGERKEDGGDGIRRQGRTGRGSAPVGPRSKLPVGPASDKAEGTAASSAKQPRSARGGAEKGDRSKVLSKTGERKQTVRPRRSSLGLPAGDVSGPASDSDDDHEELAAAVQAALNHFVNASASPFWTSVEPYFSLITADDMEFLHQQVKDVDEADPVLRVPPCGAHYQKLWQTVDAIQDETDPPSATLRRGTGRNPADSCNAPSPGLPNGDLSKWGANGALDSPGKCLRGAADGGLDAEDAPLHGVRDAWMGSVSMAQRLLAAVVDEDEICDSCDLGPGGLEKLQAPSLQKDAEAGADGAVENKKESVINGRRWSDQGAHVDGIREKDEGRRSSQVGAGKGLREKDDFLPNGCVPSGSTQEASENAGDVFDDPDDILVDGVGSGPELGLGGGGMASQDWRHSAEGEESGNDDWTRVYRGMRLDDRILLELRSIGLLGDDEPNLEQREDDEVCASMRHFQRQLQLQMEDAKRRVGGLESEINKRRQQEERQREQMVLYRLLEFAYDRRVGRTGGGPATFGSSGGGKGAASSKQARQLALATAKRALKKMEEFEEGKSVLTSALRDQLLGIAKEKEPAALNELAADSTGTGAAAGATEQSPVRAMRRSDSRDRADSAGLVARSREERGGPERAKERTAKLDEVGRAARPVLDPLGVPTLGNIKRKRTERDLDGKLGASPAGKRSERERNEAKGSGAGVRPLKEEKRAKGRPRNKPQSNNASKQATGGGMLEPEPSPQRTGAGLSGVAEGADRAASGGASDKGEKAQAPEFAENVFMPMDPTGGPPENMEGDMPFGMDMGGQTDMLQWLDNFAGDDLALNADNSDFPEEGLAIPMDDISGLDLF